MDFVAPFRASAASGYRAITLIGVACSTMSLFAGSPAQDSSTPAVVPTEGQDPALTGESAPELVIPPLSAEQTASIQKGASHLLSQAFSRAARRLFVRAEPELMHVSLAYDFAEQAVLLNEDETEVWRLLLAVAAASNPDDPDVRRTEARALAQLSRLDPDDTVIRLRRLLWAVEQGNTVEERVTRFKQLLSPESIAVIGNEVAARLALDMARLLSRSGDNDGFAQWLAQSLELDPSFPDATATAAGYFATEDIVDHAELLVAALVADPLETGFVNQLGALALDAGAFEGANRMLQLTGSSTRAEGLYSNELAVQHALALWGLGRSEDALEILAARMRDLDAVARVRVRSENPDLSPIEVVQTQAMIPANIALMEAAIRSEGDDTKAYREYVALAMKDLKTFLEPEEEEAPSFGEEETEVSPAERAAEASGFLEAALFAAWYGEDAELMDQFIAAAQERMELSSESQTRFEAWGAIVTGRIEFAIAMLISLEEEDELAALALSIAYERSGRTAEAAKLWFRLARSEPGTIIGVWSRNQLEKAIGTLVPQSEVAKELDLVIREVPASIDRILLDRDRAYSLRVEPVDIQVGPFDPIIYRVELANRSGLPLSIGPEGPILPTMAIVPAITIAGSSSADGSDWLVVTIDRQLVIEPRGSMDMTLNLNYYPISEVAIARSGVGFSLDVRAVTNFMSDGRMIGPDRLGEKVTARLLRVDGVTPDAPFRRDAFESSIAMPDTNALNLLSMLLEVGLSSGSGDVSETNLIFLEAVYEIWLGQYAQLPPAARAWLAYCAPLEADVPGYDRITSAILSDTDTLVLKTLLAKMTWGAREGADNNRYLVHLANSGDPEIVPAAEDLQEIWRIAVVELREASKESR